MENMKELTKSLMDHPIIRLFRETRFMTQKELAKYLGTYPPEISKAEGGDPLAQGRVIGKLLNRPEFADFLGDLARSLRLGQGLRPEEMADLLGVRIQEVYLAEAGDLQALDKVLPLLLPLVLPEELYRAAPPDRERLQDQIASFLKEAEEFSGRPSFSSDPLEMPEFAFFWGRSLEELRQNMAEATRNAVSERMARVLKKHWGALEKFFLDFLKENPGRYPLVICVVTLRGERPEFALSMPQLKQRGRKAA
ncbi:hypothetical protein [Thermus filiformis]|nr:hypothetical protein [Thermus filiformis]